MKNQGLIGNSEETANIDEIARSIASDLDIDERLSARIAPTLGARAASSR